jgi:hypothetical protein
MTVNRYDFHFLQDFAEAAISRLRRPVFLLQLRTKPRIKLINSQEKLDIEEA